MSTGDPICVYCGKLLPCGCHVIRQQSWDPITGHYLDRVSIYNTNMQVYEQTEEEIVSFRDRAVCKNCGTWKARCGELCNPGDNNRCSCGCPGPYPTEFYSPVVVNPDRLIFIPEGYINGDGI